MAEQEKIKSQNHGVCLLEVIFFLLTVQKTLIFEYIV